LASTGGKKVTTKTKRWYKDVGLGFRTPAGELRSLALGRSMNQSEGITLGGQWTGHRSAANWALGHFVPSEKRVSAGRG
jgi:hypothetical protein